MTPLNPVHADEIKVKVAAGAAINTNIPIPGIEPGDQLVGVIQFTETTGNFTGAEDRLAEAKITSAGNIQLTTTDTTGTTLLVIYLGGS